jgi:Asp/Glu/hydantoin racemase
MMSVRQYTEEECSTSALPDILLLNANTNTAMTETMLGAAQTLHPNCRAATVARGARYISDEHSASVAAQVVMEFAETLDPDTMPDALVIACFGDPGLWQLRDRLPIPVIGMAEASCHVACQLGRRFGIVTGGAAWKPMLASFIDDIGLLSRLSGIHTLDQTGDALAADPERALSLIAQKIDQARSDGSDVVILGGAGLVGFAKRLQSDAKVQLLDSLSCAVSQAVAVSTI